MLVRMKPGQRTDTPMPRGPSSLRSPSDSATTPYLLTLYGLLLDEIRPAMEAVDTMCPPPWFSIIGTKTSMPQTTAMKLTPSDQSQPASLHVPYGPTPPTPALLIRI